MYNRIIILSAGILSGFSLYAQDTTKTQTIEITSAYKPVLRNAVKINFSGSQLPADTSRPNLYYSIPSQNLFYAYQPISLKPLALQMDTGFYLGNRNYIKAGFGSLSTPYLKAGLSMGDGKTALANITGSYISSKGNKIENQDYAKLNLNAAASYFLPNNEVFAKLELNKQDYYLYGYDHDLFQYDKKDIRNGFMDIEIAGGVKGITGGDLLISYAPRVSYSIFTNKEKLNEGSFRLDLPAQVKINADYAFKVEALADLTKYSTKNYIPNNYEFTNNVVQIAPSVLYKAELVNFNAGVTPAWNNGEFSLLPNILVEAQIAENTLMLQAGWVGRFVKNTYKNLSAINPWLNPMTVQLNTRETEYYAGIKATLGSHFNVSAKAGFLKYKDFALFINDTASADQKGFVTVYEPTASNFKLHGDISYINKDQFSLTAALTLNAFTGFKLHDKAWHSLPMEFTASARYMAIKKMALKADFYLFGGGKYIQKGNESKGLNGGADLSAGATYQLNKNFSLWMEANNIFNDTYQRWNRYTVYGTNFVGGILIHF